MKKNTNKAALVMCLLLSVAGVRAQSIDVTASGVNVDATMNVTGDAAVAGTTSTGALVVGTSTILTEGYFESAEQVFPGSNATLTVPHGMAGTPRFTTVSLRCITPEFGWAAGDEILLSSIHMVSNNHGCTVGVNSVNFKLRQFGNIYVHRLDANGIAYISSANWRLVFRAWR